MKYENGFAKDDFLQHMFKEFPTVFNNSFSREMLGNVVDYAKSNHTVTKNGLYYFLKDMLPEVEANDLIPYIDKKLLTDEVLCLIEDKNSEVKAIHSMDELEKHLIEKGWEVYGTDVRWQISKTSPAGEYFCFFIDHDNNVEKAIEEIKQYARVFDAEIHVENLIDARKHGYLVCTQSKFPEKSVLIEDAKAIQEMLDEIADGIEFCEQKTIGETLAEAIEKAGETRNNVKGKEIEKEF